MNEASLRKKITAALPQTSPRMTEALVAVLVRGHTWRRAAIAHDVTESGICRAMQRGQLRPAPGTASKPA